MKKLILITFILAFVSVSGQSKKKLKSYTASNGITYKVGDVLWLGKGSKNNGDFEYIRIGGWAKKLSSKPIRLSFKNEDRPFTIKKMYKYRDPRWKSVHLTLGSSSSTNYTMDLDNALQSGEIKQSIEKKSAQLKPSTNDKYDQLLKIKKLLDEGILSQDEFDIEKKKILDSQ